MWPGYFLKTRLFAVDKKRIYTLLLALSIAILVGACGGGGNDINSEAVLTEAARIALEGLTQTAEAAPPTATPTEIPPTPTDTPVPPTDTPTPEGDSNNAVVPSPTTGQPAASSNNAACYRANFEIETIPDGTQLYTDKVFTKTWRLKNVGSCTWSTNFAIIWVSGDLMDADSVVPLTDVPIAPGEYVTASVKMQAPSKPGVYKGYWMLRSDDGVIFGTDANGKGTVWVEIEVIPRPDG